MRDAFLRSACAGTAALLKPTGMSVGAAFVVAMIFSNLSWGKVIRLGTAAGLGLLIPLGVAFIYLCDGHIGPDSRHLSRDFDLRCKLLLGLAVGFWKADRHPAAGGISSAGCGWISRRGRVSESDVGMRHRSMLVFVLVWLALETVGVVAQRRMYGYHFLVMAPPLALLFGWLPRRANAASLLAALLPVTALSLVGTYQMLHDEGIGPPTLAVSDYLKSHAQPGDAVWSDSTSRILLETGLRPGSRCVLTFLFANSDASPLRYSDMILGDFQARSPRFIVLDSDMTHYVQHQSTHVLEYERFPQRLRQLLHRRCTSTNMCMRTTSRPHRSAKKPSGAGATPRPQRRRESGVKSELPGVSNKMMETVHCHPASVSGFSVARVFNPCQAARHGLKTRATNSRDDNAASSQLC